MTDRGTETDVWPEYELWNEAIANVVYSESAAGRPVYLDVEDELMSRIAAELAIPEGVTPAEALAACVRRTLALPPMRGPALRHHRERLALWKLIGDPRDPPPVLPLLAVFALGAEIMAAGEGMRPTNYYGRLAAVLGMGYDEVVNWLAPDYRRSADAFFSALNGWLEVHEGRRGLPTAYAVE